MVETVPHETSHLASKALPQRSHPPRQGQLNSLGCLFVRVSRALAAGHLVSTQTKTHSRRPRTPCQPARIRCSSSLTLTILALRPASTMPSSGNSMPAGSLQQPSWPTHPLSKMPLSAFVPIPEPQLGSTLTSPNMNLSQRPRRSGTCSTAMAISIQASDIGPSRPASCAPSTTSSLSRFAGH